MRPSRTRGANARPDLLQADRSAISAEHACRDHNDADDSDRRHAADRVRHSEPADEIRCNGTGTYPRARERLTADKGKLSLRQAPKAYMKQIVERFSLSKWLGTDRAKTQMAMAGFRGPQAEVAFLFFRLVTPVLSLVISAFYTFVVTHFELAVTFKIGIIVLATYFGLKMPELYLKNMI